MSCPFLLGKGLCYNENNSMTETKGERMDKEKLHLVLEVDDDSSRISKIYNILNIVFTLLSLIPLLFHNQTETLFGIEAVAVGFFAIDYLLRWFTADVEFPNKSKIRAYLTYPFTFYALLDLLAILPFITVLNQSFRLFRIFRLFRSLRIFRAFRIFRHSKTLGLLIRTIKKQKDSLIIVGASTLAYIFIAALLVFNIEPETFPSFLEALFWATSSLTTATYGDIFPSSPLGQIVSMISYLVGVVIIALPSSIITAGYIDEMEKENDIQTEPEEEGDSEAEE